MQWINALELWVKSYEYNIDQQVTIFNFVAFPMFFPHTVDSKIRKLFYEKG